MKNYTTPEVEIIEVIADDIIQTSGLIYGGSEGTVGGDSSIFSIDPNSIN